ncbi:MAG: diacylglycerol kinase family protein [Jiangellales bacterium]
MSTRAAILTNAGAGSADSDVVERAETALADAGYGVSVVAVDEPAALDSLDVAGVHRVVIAGGDGTVHQTISTLHTRGELSPERPIGVLPLGTGNDLARGAGIPLDPDEAVDVVVGGRPRPMDLVDDGLGTVIVNAAHAGVGALASERAETFKQSLGALGYAVGAVLAGSRSSGWPMLVRVDGVDVAEPATPLLMVGLAVGATIGGGAVLAPDADPGDGWVDVVVVSATGPLQRLDFARRLRQGEHDERDDVLLMRGRSVHLEGGDAPLNVDGELLGPVGSRTWTLRPQAWSLLVPSGGSAPSARD